MINLAAISKDIQYDSYGYVFDKPDQLTKLLPFLQRRLEGEWRIALIGPKLTYVRELLDGKLVPDYVHLDLFLDKNAYGQLLMERPSLEKQEKSPWELYQEYLSTYPVHMDTQVMREIYKRAGPSLGRIKEFLVKCEKLDRITMKEVDKELLPVNRVYASQVMQAFLKHDKRRCWTLLTKFEEDLGTEIAFYALRKYLRRLLQEKKKYLDNKEFKERVVQDIDVFTILHAYYVFEQATSPQQLWPVLHCIERRTSLC